MSALRSPWLAGALALAALPVVTAQVPTPYPSDPVPGTYPRTGGRNPNDSMGAPLPMPGRRGSSAPRRGGAAQAEPVVTHTGRLRQVSDSLIVLEADDRRIFRYRRSDGTQFLKENQPLPPNEIQPGDRFRVESVMDEQGHFTARRVHWEAAGTTAERVAAARPVDILRSAPSLPGGAGGSGDDDGPPRQRRAGEPQPAASAPAPGTPEPAAPAPAEAEEPAVASRPATQAPAIIPDDPEDAGPPRQQRGRTARRTASVPRRTPAEPAAVVFEPTPEEAAPARTAAAAEAPTAARASVEGEDPIISKTRLAAAEYQGTLPDYMVQQHTTRHISTTRPVSWRAMDTLSADLVVEKGAERYQNLKRNGKPITEAKMQETGSWSAGEFASTLDDLLSPATAARFRKVGQETVNGREAIVYDYAVTQPHSHWTIHSGSQSIRPAYGGTMWIDKATHRVLRIEMEARQLPEDFPLDKLELALDYGAVRLSGQEFLLPIHSENLSCRRGEMLCSRNTLDFRNYRKYGSDTSVTFEP